MKEYEAKTKPLLDVFEKMGVLINCEAKKGIKDYPELKKMVEKKLAQIWSFFKGIILFILLFLKLLFIHFYSILFLQIFLWNFVAWNRLEQLISTNYTRIRGFLFLDLQSVRLVVMVLLSSVGLLVPFFLALLSFWLWFSNNCESVVFQLLNLLSLPGSHDLLSFQRWVWSWSLFFLVFWSVVGSLSVWMVWVVSSSFSTLFSLSSWASILSWTSVLSWTFVLS